MNAIRLALSMLATFLLAACVTHPGPLRGDYAPITPQEALNQDSTGTMVRWGGRVVEVMPQQDRTCFQVISTRLGASGRPYHDSDDVRGRFVACRAGFYDPAVFEKNREVTFTGRVDGYETYTIGEYDYRLPRIDASVVYLWPVRDQVDVISQPLPYSYYSPWGRPWWYW